MIASKRDTRYPPVHHAGWRAPDVALPSVTARRAPQPPAARRGAHPRPEDEAVRSVEPGITRDDATLVLLVLALLGGSHRPLAPPPEEARLSTRQRQVIRLVARGMTNMQVAEALFISPRTVERHLTTIYNKLGISSRNAATRYALQHGLG